MIKELGSWPPTFVPPRVSKTNKIIKTHQVSVQKEPPSRLFSHTLRAQCLSFRLLTYFSQFSWPIFPPKALGTISSLPKLETSSCDSVTPTAIGLPLPTSLYYVLDSCRLLVIDNVSLSMWHHGIFSFFQPTLNLDFQSPSELPTREEKISRFSKSLSDTGHGCYA